IGYSTLLRRCVDFRAAVVDAFEEDGEQALRLARTFSNPTLRFHVVQFRDVIVDVITKSVP
ncbi:unnamed protein product, partial [Prorocentrum cordatum]